MEIRCVAAPAATPETQSPAQQSLEQGHHNYPKTWLGLLLRLTLSTTTHTHMVTSTTTHTHMVTSTTTHTHTLVLVPTPSTTIHTHMVSASTI